MVSIPERIIEVLETESKLTIKDISERLNESNDKLEYVRICIYRLLKSKSPRIVKDGKKGKEYLYSLKENAEITIDNELTDKLVLLMIEAEINSEKYGINITENEIDLSIKRLQERGRI